ncbi:PREDICTED: PHD and RING finger domain-containing protein 1 isoform X2 [Propithecus coquereli]|uniref:PHD and RING finger domain-containing protein 1 isoform X2 n=1 Tax=Propithecus coquereli TaxID=379532 RepID=UPI00063F6040|nr:PREDICTED: PHD and RING finger domain-containing protein 1 isoform X2 [Propithecus coquereli]
MASGASFLNWHLRHAAVAKQHRCALTSPGSPRRRALPLRLYRRSPGLHFLVFLQCPVVDWRVAKLQCAAMDDDSLDERVARSPGPDGRPRVGPRDTASDFESNDGSSGDSEGDTDSELGDGADGEDEAGSEQEDLEDRSGSEDSEDDAEALVVVADTQEKLEAGSAFMSDDDADSCPICLNVFRDQAVGTPENCAHYFCLDCILEWSKNANSCPVDRTMFKCICVRAQFGGKVLKKVPVESTRAREEEEEDPTFCEVCGRSDHEDRLLLCDGCDAGYHMECLDPPLQEVPVDEWFCPECAAPGVVSAADAGPVSEEEVSLLLADVVPTTSRLRPRTGRTRAIARTRHSERVRATVNRNRISTARRAQQVPRYLTSSLLDETIEAVAAGLSTAVYQRPLAPRAPARRKRKTGRRKKVQGRKKTPSRASVKSKRPATRPKKRQRRTRKRKGKQRKSEVTARSRIARTLGLCRPVRGTCIPSVYKTVDPSLGLMRAEIGAASLSVFGDPYELDSFDSSEELSANPPSPLSAKRRALSRSALRSHQPVARPVSVGLSRRGLPALAPEPHVEEAPVPDLLGSILSEQSLLMMSGADVVIHRDGSLSAKRAAPVSFQQNSVGPSKVEEGSRSQDCPQPGAPPSGSPAHRVLGNGPQSSGLSCQGRSAPSCTPARTSGAPVRLESAAAPGPGQAQNLSNGSGPGLRQSASPRFNGTSKHALPLGSTSSKLSSSRSNYPCKSAILGHALKPAPRRADISELPRIPKIRRNEGSGRQDAAPARGQSIEIPSACISRLTGREGPGQPERGAQAESDPSGRAPQEPSRHTGSSRPPAPLGPSRGKGVGSTFESFRINIPGNAAHAGRLSSPGFCNTFRPVDSKVQRKENPSPLFSIKKTKQLKSEIYDPFDPTGSDSSPPSSSPESLGSGLLPSEITRTISIDSPKAPASQAVRCVTSYTVENVFGVEPAPTRKPPSGVLQLQGEGAAKGASDTEREGLDEEGLAESQGTAARVQRPRPPEPWDEEDRASCGTFFGSEERTVTCVTVVEPDAPPSPDVPQAATHRVVELRSPSRSRSTSSSRSRKTSKRKRAARERQRTCSGTRSGSRDRSSRSASPSVGEDHTKRHRSKAKSRRSSSDHDRSSSRERAKRRKAKDRSKEWRRGPWGHGRRPSRSRSGSPGSSSYEHYESRKKRKPWSGSRPRGRECSPHSSLERAHRHRHQRERSRERPDRKGSVARPRERKRRSRSPSSEHRMREPRRPRSREKRPRTWSRSPERKGAAQEASPGPRPLGESRQDGDHRPPALAEAGVPPELAVAVAHEAPSEAPPALEVPAQCVPDDLDYGDSVEAGHVFEDFSGDAVFIQLDDMSSPPSPESTDSSPERDFPQHPGLPPASVAMAAIQREVSLIHGEDAAQPPLQAEGPQEQHTLGQDVVEASAVPGAPGAVPVAKEDGPAASGQVQEEAGPEEVVPQPPLLRSRAPVKRVTWNLQESEGSTLAEDRAPRTPLHRPQKPWEGAWDVEDVAPGGVRQATFSELPPSHVLPEPGFPGRDPAQVCSPDVPAAPAQLPTSFPPCVPAGQPPLQPVLQGTLPLVGCGPAQSLAPMLPVLTSASEPASQATIASNSEERTPAPRPAAEKTKKEEYLKKLHMQERAVEEVKLAIKPFYQKREVTKEEYKDILRKAVQKICHSKSGEINPVKVANLVKAYVDKYRHMRRHKKPEAGEEPPTQGAEA